MLIIEQFTVIQPRGAAPLRLVNAGKGLHQQDLLHQTTPPPAPEPKKIYIFRRGYTILFESEKQMYRIEIQTTGERVYFPHDADMFDIAELVIKALHGSDVRLFIQIAKDLKLITQSNK
jgi:hypothetical protein